MIQLSFKDVTEVNTNMYEANKCKACLNGCKIYSISKNSIIYCKKYKRA